MQPVFALGRLVFVDVFCSRCASRPRCFEIAFAIDAEIRTATRNSRHFPISARKSGLDSQQEVGT